MLDAPGGDCCGIGIPNAYLHPYVKTAFTRVNEPAARRLRKAVRFGADSDWAEGAPARVQRQRVLKSGSVAAVKATGGVRDAAAVIGTQLF